VKLKNPKQKDGHGNICHWEGVSDPRLDQVKGTLLRRTMAIETNSIRDRRVIEESVRAKVGDRFIWSAEGERLRQHGCRISD